MAKTKILLMIVLMLVISMSVSSIVSANPNWFQEANADLSLPGGNGFIGYGSNINNLLTNQTYTQCDISKSVFTPIATDLDGNGITNIITTPGARLELYTLDCEFITDLALGETPRAMPVIVNFDEDDKQEIAVLLSDRVELYEYDSDISSFVEIDSLDYSLFTTNLDYLTCPRDVEFETCIGFDKGNDEVYVFNFGTDTVGERENELPQPIFNLGAIDQGVSNGRTLGNERFRVPNCLSQGTSTNYFSCNTINVTGFNQSISTGNLGSASFAVTNIYYSSVFYAKMGNALRIFVNIDYEKNNAFDRSLTYAFDSGFSSLHIPQTEDSSNFTSNWMVADYNKDGISDACYLINITPDTFFRCWDVNFLSMTTNINVTGVINLTKSAVLADFNSSQSTLGLATMEGIFYENETGDIFNQVTSSDRTASGYSSGIVVSVASTGSPAYVYADSTSGFIIRDSTATSSCGNGECEVFENAFSCPADCSVNVSGLFDESEICEDNDECYTGYCLGGVCTLLPENFECDFDDQCLSGSCSNDECTKPSIDKSFEGLIAGMLGDDPATLNLVAILCIFILFIAIFATIFSISGHAIAGLIIGGIVGLVASLVFLTWGWLNGWIFLISLLVLVIIAFILLMLRSPVGG